MPTPKFPTAAAVLKIARSQVGTSTLWNLVSEN